MLSYLKLYVNIHFGWKQNISVRLNEKKINVEKKKTYKPNF